MWWSFKKKECNCEIATAYRLVAWWDDMKPEYETIISRKSLREQLQEFLLKNWWYWMKPDWTYLREHNYRTICEHIPTSWYIQTSNNVCYHNDSEGTYG